MKEMTVTVVQAESVSSMFRYFLDVAIAVVVLIFFSPVILLIALAIRLTQKGSIIFRQERIGQGRQPFVIYKFRTMKMGADSLTPVPTSGDSRITMVGKILRPTHLDELPQFWNVIKGDMTIVGPRPKPLEHANQLAEFIPGYFKRTSVKPGITGLAQVRKSHDPSLQSQTEKFWLDLEYIRTRSLLADLKIMLLTIVVMIKRNGG